ncbi:MAG: rod shape-determining protein MreC [Lapillicoccus sp.]
MTAYARRRVLLLGTALTVLVLLLDLAGSSVPARMRAAGAAVGGPAQRVLAGVDPGQTARLEEENARLSAEVERDRAALAEAAQLGRLLSSPAGHAPHVLAARVIASSTTASGAREVTLDVGSRDGVEPDVTVVAAEGLVGRVMSVGPWSSDVRLLGGAEATVGVRVGAHGSLGSVSASPPPGTPSRPRGMLSLTLVDEGSVAVGDSVTTLGSVGGRPYGPGIVVGTVLSVDPLAGRLTATAVVRPAVDPSRLGVVAVLLGDPRDAARPAAAAATLAGAP